MPYELLNGAALRSVDRHLLILSNQISSSESDYHLLICIEFDLTPIDQL